MGKQLDELGVLKKVNEMLEALTDEERRRVLDYTVAKWAAKAVVRATEEKPIDWAGGGTGQLSGDITGPKNPKHAVVGR